MEDRPEPPVRRPRRRIPYNIGPNERNREASKRTRDDQEKLTPEFFEYDKLEQEEETVALHEA